MIAESVSRNGTGVDILNLLSRLKAIMGKAPFSGKNRTAFTPGTWSVSGKLNLLAIMILIAGVVGVIGAMGIHKGARLHELNTLHVKYNHEFFNTVLNFQAGADNLGEMRRDIIDVRAQPIGCLDEINTFDELFLEMIGTARAVRLCEEDIALANRTLKAINDYVAGDLSRSELESLLNLAEAGFRSNSEAFEPLVTRTVGLIYLIVISILIAQAIVAPLVGYLLSRSVGRDYKHLKETEEALETARQDAERANTMKSEFLANVSHELRTPINGIIGMADVLAEKDMGPDVNEKVTIIRESGKNLVTLVNDLLDLSKIEAGCMKLEPRLFSLDELVCELAAVWKTAAEAKGLDFTLDCTPTDGWQFTGDDMRITQVLANLLGNAVKFTSEGGIRFNVTVDEVTPGLARLVFTVQDTGIGISDEAKGSLFRKFTQADASITRRYGGTGLGLAICKRISGLMGGTVRVESRNGAGSTFVFDVTLPVEEAMKQHTESAVEHKPAETQLSGARLLVAEDNLINQRVVEAILAAAGTSCDFVENGEEAVQAVRRGEYDLILMDDQMPVMDGVTATKAIRSLESPKSAVPIVAITANAMVGDKERYLEAGMDAYVSKPIDSKILFSTLADLLAGNCSVKSRHNPKEVKRPEEAKSA